jgi:hypothetical protein
MAGLGALDLLDWRPSHVVTGQRATTGWTEAPMLAKDGRKLSGLIMEGYLCGCHAGAVQSLSICKHFRVRNASSRTRPAEKIDGYSILRTLLTYNTYNHMS